MASTTFTDGQSVIYSSWLNDVNSAVYNGTFQATTISPTNLSVSGTVSGSGFTTLVNNTLSAPGAIGSVTPNTGAFTTLTATSLTGLTTPLSVAQGGTGVTTSTGSGANVLGTSPTISSPTISGAVVSSMASSVLTLGTSQTSTSGTTIDFTGIPSWVKRITVMLNGVSTNGTSNLILQVGSGSITSSGYSGTVTEASTSSYFSTSFQLRNSTAASLTYPGIITLYLFGSNIYVANGIIGNSATNSTAQVAGVVTLSGALDRVRITTVNGTDTFDAGSINILYE